MLNERVDSARLIDLANQAVSRELRAAVSDFPRLSSCVVPNRDATGSPAALSVDLRFAIGPEGFPTIDVAVAGELQLECQRCLEPVDWPVRVGIRLTVLEDDAQSGAIADPFDSVTMGAEGLDLGTLVEDEVLASLPIAPVHADESGCRSETTHDENSPTDAELMHRPFANLAGLLGGQGSDADD